MKFIQKSVALLARKYVWNFIPVTLEINFRRFWKVATQIKFEN